MLARSDWPADYEEVFWENYPRRIAKKDALRALYKIRKANEVPFEVLLSAVKVYGNSMIGKEMRYIAHPATWLNAGRWDDAPEALLDGKMQAPALALRNGQVLIRQGSPQAVAWAKHRGRDFPYGRSGVWFVDSEYPPEIAK